MNEILTNAFGDLLTVLFIALTLYFTVRISEQLYVRTRFFMDYVRESTINLSADRWVKNRPMRKHIMKIAEKRKVKNEVIEKITGTHVQEQKDLNVR